MYRDTFVPHSSLIIALKQNAMLNILQWLFWLIFIGHTQERASMCNCLWMHARFPDCPTRNRTDLGYPVVRSHAYN